MSGNNQLRLPELLIPAGSMSKLRMALAYGADAVYVGASGFSMRPDEASLGPDDMARAVDMAHSQGKRLYVALNAMMFDDDLAEIRSWLEETAEQAVDAIIVSDAGVFSLVKELRPDVAIHISTQAAVSNRESAAFWQRAGASRVIVARECSLEQVSDLTSLEGLEIEMFVHGAMCMAISGRCLLSAHLCGSSGSRGQCKHSCRWDWQLVESKRPNQSMPVFETGRGTIFLGSTDLCLIEHIPELVEAGLASLKVEGRMKGEAYIATVTRIYRAALDLYAADPESYRFDSQWLEELESVSHRPYATGFAFGYPEATPEKLQAAGPSVSTTEVLGFVNRISDGIHLVSAKNPFAVDETIEWIGPDMTGGTVRVEKILNANGKECEKTHCGTEVQVKFAGGECISEYAVLRRSRSGSVKADIRTL